jgi:hypothetical protein
MGNKAGEFYVRLLLFFKIAKIFSPPIDKSLFV